MKKVSCTVLSILIMTSICCISANAYRVGSYTKKDTNNNSIYNIYLWNETDQTNNEYTIHADLTHYASSSYTFGAIFASMYGYNISTQTWEDSLYDANMNELNDYKSMWYFASDYSLNKAFVSHELYEDNFIPSQGRGTVVLGTYNTGGTMTNYYNYTYYYKASQSSPLVRKYFHRAETYTFSCPWNFG